MTSPSIPKEETEASRKQRALAGVEQLSERLLHDTRDVADQGDRWFLAAVRGLDRSVAWGSTGIGKLGGRLAQGWSKLRSARWSSDAARRRIRKALITEARRAEVDPESEDFQAFSQNLATLVELVLTGAIRLDDVGFAFEEASASDGAPTGQPEAPEDEEMRP